MENILPKGWVETDLDTVIERMSNGSSLKQYEEFFEGSLPISRIETIANETIDFNRVKYVDANESEIEKYELLDGDILFSHINSDKHLGKTAFFQNEETLLHGINLLLLRSSNVVNSEFIYLVLRDLRYSGKFIEVAQRSVNQSSINQKKLKAFRIPLPPRAEQHRIVAKVDALMTQYAAIQQAMERIPPLLKDFRQQVLTQAVTGKLTEEWRVGKELGEWEMKSSNKVFSFITSGSRGWAKYYSPSGTQLFVRITNMNFGTFHLDLSLNKLQFLELPENNEGKRTLLKVNDILISITGDVGMVSLIQGDFTFEAYVNQHVCLARPNNSNDAKFISYYLMSKEGFGQFESKKRGATKSGLTLGDIRSLTINIPDLLEQQEIVRRVESLFEKATAIEQRYEQLKEQIDTLPQSILHKAFKGELVEQLASDGSAVELLEEIKKLKLNSNLKGEIKSKSKIKAN
ncbi:hypothetical protein F0365_07940 [Nonlabens sp. Ci31]|uniref:restriction endonuclease subunit S n=1 Tax=Nonlabens sp. Ci31 TaxID=2608253 RepID=UPI0014644414|nr:restriction endonuclease subunit S [Nonlabens sp. Ci31]QJP34331.1 hypothetical protein F0365_07940 [Nonlabens sp. Ci31]